MSFTVASCEDLPHNPANAVTGAVERISDARGGTRVRKRLRHPRAASTDSVDTDQRWAGSDDPAHRNFWRREADVYRDVEVRDSLVGTGLDLADAEVDVGADGATLLLEDVPGVPGERFGLEDHVFDLVRLGITASAVKYAWLLPLMLARAGDAEHRTYQRTADAEPLYAQRGSALAQMVRWCDEAVQLLGRTTFWLRPGSHPPHRLGSVFRDS